ncbi:GTP cyclohydrolase 1 [Hibiscus syriacus]|uniref:GTP cyclohydrolase 1 n=1 Tax=Hibiscus syriacus TaxID=106335 RepID=A0A6A2YBW9_HIBSY|nr:GTP cyclohydrolase 1 [Hibiscus syriacus]
MNFQNTKFNGFTCGTKPLVKSTGECSNNHQQMHSELNLSFWSQCEHHLLPFHGVVHIGYMCPEGFNPIEKCLLQSIVHYYGFKLQVQERLSRQIAEAVSSITGGDTMVVVEAYHTCMISIGIQKFGSNTATVAVMGRFSTDSAARAMFLDTIPNIAASGLVVMT